MSSHLKALRSRAKALAAFALALCLIASSALVGCSSAQAPADPVTMKIGALRGPTGMGLVQMIDESTKEAFSNDFEFTLAGSADELAPQLVKGELDALCVPANLAATLYQKTGGEVEVLAVNTLGVLDIVEAGDTVHSMADLRGKTIVSAGKGTTPQYALEYLLEQNGLTPGKDVKIEWKSEHAECLAALQADRETIAMLPQPFATSALAKVDGARIALDLTDVWNETAEKTGATSQLVTGVVVARTDFVEENPAAIEEFMDAYAASVSFVNDNADEAAQLIEQMGIIDASVAKKALPYCNIVFLTGDDMRTALEGYLQTLYDADPASVGGAMPDDAFYYTA